MPMTVPIVSKKSDSMIEKIVSSAVTAARRVKTSKLSPRPMVEKSGHATIAFSSAAFIQRRYGWKGGVPAYLVASYTGWLRLETDDHDVADVVGGAAIGMLSAYLLSDRFADSIRTSAWTNGRSGGLQVEVRW